MAEEPVDVEAALADPEIYERAILKIFEKRSVRGRAFHEADEGVSYYTAATDRRALAARIAETVAAGAYRPSPVDLWHLTRGGKTREAHTPAFTDQVVGAALFPLLSRNARCLGMPGVYSYFPGTTALDAMAAFARFVRAERRTHGAGGPPADIHVLQSDFKRYGDDLPVHETAYVWTALRAATDLGNPRGAVSEATWRLVKALVRPAVRDRDGTVFCRLYGVAMGTPLVPIVSNLAAKPVDDLASATPGLFYARYNDDFIIAHRDAAVVSRLDREIDGLLAPLGVRRKLEKDIRTCLNAAGRPSADDPRFRGRHRIDCLGLSVAADGRMTVGPHRIARLVRRIAGRLDDLSPTLHGLPPRAKARRLVEATNVMLDPKSPFAVPGLAALLEATTDRGALADIDNRLFAKIAQLATGRPGVTGFRLVPPAVLRRECGLVSLVALRNRRGRRGG